MSEETSRSESPSNEDRPGIGVFGGTFDPIHLGHLIVAAEALHSLRLDQLLFVPAGQPPHKPGSIISSNEDRCSMIEIAIDLRPAFHLSEIDLKRPGPSYSADLLEILGNDYDGSDLYFVIGADSLRDFHTWHEPHRIPELATVVVAARPGAEYQLDEVLNRTPALANRLQFIDVPLIDVSAIKIRERVRQGNPIWYQVPLGVEQYIVDHELYR